VFGPEVGWKHFLWQDLAATQTPALSRSPLQVNGMMPLGKRWSKLPARTEEPDRRASTMAAYMGAKREQRSTELGILMVCVWVFEECFRNDSRWGK